MRRSTWIVLAVVAVAVGVGAFAWAGGVVGDGGEDTVAFADVQEIFTTVLRGCHPVVVNRSICRRATPTRRSSASARSSRRPAVRRRGRPGRLLPVPQGRGLAGEPRQPHHRRPDALRQGPLPAAELDTIRRGSCRARSTRVRADAVHPDRGPHAGPVAALPAGEPPAALQPGDGRIEGIVTGADHQPIAGAVVAMLVVREDLPGGEEHYLAGVTDDDGRTHLGAPVGRVEIKAYAPGTTYVSRLLETAAGPSRRATWGCRSRRPDADGRRRPACAGR